MLVLNTNTQQQLSTNYMLKRTPYPDFNQILILWKPVLRFSERIATTTSHSHTWNISDFWYVDDINWTLINEYSPKISNIFLQTWEYDTTNFSTTDTEYDIQFAISYASQSGVVWNWCNINFTYRIWAWEVFAWKTYWKMCVANLMAVSKSGSSSWMTIWTATAEFELIHTDWTITVIESVSMTAPTGITSVSSSQTLLHWIWEWNWVVASEWDILAVKISITNFQIGMWSTSQSTTCWFCFWWTKPANIFWLEWFRPFQCSVE